MNQPPRIILVSWHPPESDAIAARRLTSFLRYLPAEGWRVELVTSKAGSPSEGYRRHIVADPVARLRSRIAAIPAPLARVASAILFRLFIVDEQLVWSLRVRRLVRRQRPDYVLITGPPFSQWLITSGSRERRTRTFLDYRDLWTSSGYFRGKRLTASVAHRVERMALNRAEGVTTVSQPLARDLEKASSLPVCVVMNGVDEDEIVPDEGPRAVGPLTLTYGGQLYAGRRDPTVLFQAIAHSRLTPEQLRVRFFVPNPLEVERIASALGINDIVSVAPTIPRAEMLHIQRESDALILLLWNNKAEEGVFTGKLFEYIATRRPIVMQGWPEGVAARLIRERGLGVVSNSPEELASMLMGWARQKRTEGLDIQIAPKCFADLTRKDQARALSKFLSVDASPRP